MTKQNPGLWRERVALRQAGRLIRKIRGKKDMPPHSKRGPEFKGLARQIFVAARMARAAALSRFICAISASSPSNVISSRRKATKAMSITVP